MDKKEFAMKKIIILLLLIFPLNAYAQTVLDNYNIEVKIDYPKVIVKETFDVLRFDEKTTVIREIRERPSNLEVNTDINNYVLKTYNNIYTQIIGDLTTGNSYYIEYQVKDYTDLGNHPYSFRVPDDIIVNNVHFKISYNSQIENVMVSPSINGAYNIEQLSYAFTGDLIDRESTPNFIVSATKKTKKTFYEEIDKRNQKEEETREKGQIISKKYSLKATGLLIGMVKNME